MNDTKETIIDIADQLFYQQGYEYTSFADIAEEVGISRGNFYHHFKSKSDILDAVIQKRLSKTEKMLHEWQNEGQSPLERIRCFIRILIMNRAKIKYYGCPVGTLTTELSKLDHPSLSEASAIFSLFADWLEVQFSELDQGKNARSLALHLLARTQGIATLASAFHDESFLHKEADTLNDWLTAITTQKK